MTIRTAVLPQNDTQIYRRIADRLEREVSHGVLLPGSSPGNAGSTISVR